MGTATIFGDAYTTAMMPDGKEWLAQNLRTSLAPNKAPNGNEANVAVYGRLYQYDIAKALTYPDGWRVPTQAEWDALTGACGGLSISGGRLKEVGTAHWSAPNTSATDTYGFAAMPAGTYYAGSGYSEFGTYANFWSKWEFGVGNEVRYLAYNSAAVVSYDIPSQVTISNYWFSVRLVRDYSPPSGFSGVRPAKSGAWRNASEAHVAKDGAWHKANRIFVPVSGAWREVL